MFRYRGMKDGLHRVEDTEDGSIDELTDQELRQGLLAVGAIEGLILMEDGSVEDDFGVVCCRAPKAPPEG